MKKNLRLLIPAIAILFSASQVKAQYTSIVNQAANMIQTAVMGGASYKGFVDVSYTGGVGNLRANFVGISTIHGFQMKDWFFMGAGLGVDYVYSHTNQLNQGSWGNKGVRKSGAMIPIFTDFRFNIGGRNTASFFIDIKAGGEFLIGKNYLTIENGYINGSEYFMLKPSLGVRIPTSRNGKQAFNIGVTYQLLTCNYWYNYDSSGTINSIGGTLSYEW